MKTTTKIWSMAIIGVALIAFSMGYLWDKGYFHRSPKTEANVFMLIETPQGYDQIAIGNVITDIGESLDRDRLVYLNDTGLNRTSVISLGNASVVQTLTKLTTEATTGGFTRANGTITSGQSGGDHYFNVTYMFTSTLDMNVNATGLHWSGVSNSDTNMFACASLGAAYSFPSGSNCTIVWQVVIDAN